MKFLLITTALLALTGAAKADFVMVGGSSGIDAMAIEQADTKLNDDPGSATTHDTGKVGTVGVNIDTSRPLGAGTFATATEKFNEAGGFATIKPAGTVLDVITFTPTALAHFTSFTTRGQLETDPLFKTGTDAVKVFIVVNDNLGNIFTFTEDKPNQDFSPIGAEAIAGTGEWITNVSVFTNDPGGFKEVKQVTFGFETSDAVAAVPEASTWMMMIAGFFGIGGITMAKRRREGQAFRLV